MESLYRKYRPLTFESVVGQQHIVSTLEHAVSEGRLSHAYLFCGPRGTGKTTMARILAKSLLCEGSEAARAAGASGCMPDGTCPECEAIAAGTHPDVYELDAASRTGVDNVREEIINSVNFSPVRGAYKVYIIDEVHMLTTAAFNALLKTLEEPPSHVVFVLCTTDPQKLLETILSRCQRFDFHRISNDDIVSRLRYICEQEGFAFDEDALEIVAKHARGGMRDALSTLEQLSVFGGGAVRTDDAQTLLGEVASTVLSEFSCKIAVRDTVGLFGLVRDQVDEGNDLLDLTRDLVAHMRDVYTAAIAGPRVELFDGTPEEVAAFVDEAALFEGADRLARTLTVLDDAALEMRNASDPRLVLEIALTRLARPETDLTLEALAERLAHVETQLAAGIQRGPMTPEQRASVTPAKPIGARAVSPASGVRPTGAPLRNQAVAQEKSSSSTPASTRAGGGKPATGSMGVTAPVGGASAAHTSRPSDLAPVSSAPSAPVPGAVAEVPPAAVSAPIPSNAGVPAPAPVPGALRVEAAVPAPASQGAAASVSPAAAPQKPAVPVASATVPAEAQPDMAACAVTPPSADAGELQRRWLDAVKHITAAQPSRGALLQSSRAVSDDGETLTIAFPKGSTFAIKMISRADSHELVMPIICQVFGKRNVTYVMDGEPTGGSPSTPSSAQTPAPVAPAQVPVPAPAAAGAAADAASSAPTPQATARPASVADDPTPQPVPSQPSSVAGNAQDRAPVFSASSQPAVQAAQPAVSASSPAASTPVPASANAPTSQSSPSDGTDPSAPVPPAPAMSAAPSVDQTSSPTVLPEPDVEADRRAWENEQVPYDDAAIASYAEDDEVPPFDVPADPAPTASPSMPSAPAPNATGAAAPQVSSGAPVPSGDDTPVTTEDAEALLQGIWGNVVIKPVE